MLALVIERPSYGYELSRRFDERFGELYPVSRSRIYQVLDQLLRNGLIEQLPFDDTRQSLRQPRPHYKATAEGARLHREWIAAAIQDDPRREELLRRLLAISARDTSAMLQIVDIYERACLDDLAASRPHVLESVAGDGAATSQMLRDLLIAEERRLAHEMRLQFIAFARRHINAGLTGAGGVSER